MIDLAKYDSQINAAAAKYGLSPNTLRTFIRIESSGNPHEASDAGYKGLLQMGDKEWKRYGGGGDVFNATDNINAGAHMLSDHAKYFESATGRAPNDNDLYLIHQQGRAGAVAHVSNLAGKAWENVAEYYPNERVAKSAIWGNLSKADQQRFGSVDNVTSGDFMNTWKGKVAANGGSVDDNSPIPPGVTPTAVTTSREQTPAYDVPSELSTGAFDKPLQAATGPDAEFDKKLADLDTHLVETRRQQEPSPREAPPALSAAIGSSLGGIGGPTGAVTGAMATPPGTDPLLVAALMAQQEKQRAAPPAIGQQPGAGGNVLSLLANPTQVQPVTQSMLSLMAGGRDRSNALALLNSQFGGVT